VVSRLRNHSVPRVHPKQDTGVMVLAMSMRAAIWPKLNSGDIQRLLVLDPARRSISGARPDHWLGTFTSNACWSRAFEPDGPKLYIPAQRQVFRGLDGRIIGEARRATTVMPMKFLLRRLHEARTRA
jgi:hypothetical protein